MTDAPIPHFPVVHGNIYPDGSAHINFAGHDVPLTPANLNEARQQITSYAVVVARDILRRPVRLTTVDPDGMWTLAAHPDGRVTDLAPTIRPAKRSKRRRPASAAPQPAPAAHAQPAAGAPPTARIEPERPDRTLRGVSFITEPAVAAPLPPMNAPVWAPVALPTAAEVTVFIERHQPALTTPVLTVSFAGGDVVRITSTALVGRRPINNTSVDLDVHRVEDPSRNLSRTHFAITWAEDVPAIVDRHSGNGTVVERGDVQLVATPGVPLPLQDGDHLRFGDLRAEVTLSVERLKPLK